MVATMVAVEQAGAGREWVEKDSGSMAAAVIRR